jgi:acetyl esterase/lipase
LNTSYIVSPGTSLTDVFSPDAISANTLAVNAELARILNKVQLPDGLPDMRAAYSNGDLGLPSSPKSPVARTMTIEGPAGPIEMRVLMPAGEVRGVYLHLHGGGWMFGSNDTWDQYLELFGREAGMAAVSINYRLAPEHVFPAAADDCVAAANWLIDHAEEQFGSSWLAIGGESAGAHLAALTLLRLREAGRGDAFRAANMLFGVFDLSLTPSCRLADDTLMVNYGSIANFASTFAGQHDVRDPAISPLYADLRGLPPAFFTVGTIDPLVDDTLFMHSRWQAAGNQAWLAVYPGGVHGFNSLSGDIAHAANLAMAHFLAWTRNEHR